MESECVYQLWHEEGNLASMLTYSFFSILIDV